VAATNQSRRNAYDPLYLQPSKAKTTHDHCMRDVGLNSLPYLGRTMTVVMLLPIRGMQCPHLANYPAATIYGARVVSPSEMGTSKPPDLYLYRPR